MYHALGIISEMSIDNHQLGGIHLYFSSPQEIFFTSVDSTPILGFNNWANDVMSEYCFLQIRAMLHPEIDVSTIDDKCHQLLAAIQSLNAHTNRAFILGRHCYFDEGGIASSLDTIL